MAYKKRTEKMVTDDAKRLVELAENCSNIFTYEDLAKVSGLSIGQVNTSLNAEKHPRYRKKVVNALESNKRMRDSDVVSPIQIRTDSAKTTSTNSKTFVIDASICGLPGIFNALLSEIKNGANLVLTAVTIDELDSLKGYNDLSAKNARQLLSFAVRNLNTSVFVVNVDLETFSNDDAILNYCMMHKDCVLLSGDHAMLLKASLCGITSEHAKDFVRKAKFYSRPVNLYNMYAEDSEFFINCEECDRKIVYVVKRSGKTFTSGKISLSVGDKVYIARKKGIFDDITFSEFKITQLSESDNAILKNFCKSTNYHRYVDRYSDNFRNFIAISQKLMA